MAIVLVRDRLSEEEFRAAKQNYGSYIKITLDLEFGVAALGGEYHADAEKLLLEKGLKSPNIWGGGINLETKKFETNAIINLKPGVNESTEILNPETRKKFLKIAKNILKVYA